jgi:hypothetical protein
MATRRIKMLTNNHYVQPFKLRTGRNIVLTPGSSYNSVLFTQSHMATTPKDYQLNLWAKFAQNNFDGIHVLSYLEKTGDIVQSTNYTFKIYSISTDSNWAETLVATKPGVALPDGSFKCEVTAAEFPSPIVLDGDLTFAVEVTCNRVRNKYIKKIYVNHLGVYDSIVRLRKKVDFLTITKLDE